MLGDGPALVGGTEFLIPTEDTTYISAIDIGYGIATGVEMAIASAVTEDTADIDWDFLIANWEGNAEGGVLAGWIVDNQAWWLGNIVQGSATNPNAGKLNTTLSITVAETGAWGIPTGNTTIYNVQMNFQAAPGQGLNPNQIAQGWVNALNANGFSGVNLAAQNGPFATGLGAINGFTISLGHKTNGVIDGYVVNVTASTQLATDVAGNPLVIAPGSMVAGVTPITVPSVH
jgi:hypothetical protein